MLRLAGQFDGIKFGMNSFVHLPLYEGLYFGNVFGYNFVHGLIITNHSMLITGYPLFNPYFCKV